MNTLNNHDLMKLDALVPHWSLKSSFGGSIGVADSALSGRHEITSVTIPVVKF
jgi:hypothetical protein